MPQTIPTPPLGKSITLEDGRRVISRPKSGGMGALEPLVLPPAGGVGDGIAVWGQAEIRNGPGTCMVDGCGCGEMHFVARNKISQLGLQHIMNRAFKGHTDSSSSSGVFRNAAFTSNDTGNSYIRVGTGGGATVQGTVGLTTQVATNPSGTIASGISLSLGVQSLSFTATWNAGVIAAATVTEIGIFGLLNDGLNETPSSSTTNVGNSSALILFARLSVADGEFSSFVINTAAPLSIQYTVSLAFV